MMLINQLKFKSSIDKDIIRLATPNIISNISIPLLGMIDLAIVGHLETDIYIGAIAIGTMIFNFIYWSFGFLRMGTSGLSAQAYGQKKHINQQKIIVQGLFLSLVISISLIILQWPIAKLTFFLIEGTVGVEKLALEYFYIRIWAAPATLGLYVFYGWFLGMQNAKIPMIIAISGNIINTIANLIFVYGFDMNSNGVAYGTVIAQYSSLIMAIYFMYKNFNSHLKFSISIKNFIQKSEIANFIKLNKDIFIRTLCLIAVFTFFTSSSAAQTNEILAINTLLLQFFMFFSFFEDGFAYAAEALVGKLIGQNARKDLTVLIKKLFKWGFIVSLVFSFIYLFFSNFFLGLLTNKTHLIEASQEYLIYIALIPIFSFASFIWDGIFIGATASKEMRNTMIIATLAVFFPLYFIFFKILNLENHSIWLALLLFLLARGIGQTILANSMLRIKNN